MIHHQDCADGVGAAYPAWLKLGNNVIYVLAKHDGPPPETQPETQPGSTVHILDSSYPRDTIAALSETNTLVLLDHHKTAQQELEGMPGCYIDTAKSGTPAYEHFRLQLNATQKPTTISGASTPRTPCTKPPGPTSPTRTRTPSQTSQYPQSHSKVTT